MANLFKPAFYWILRAALVILRRLDRVSFRLFAAYPHISVFDFFHSAVRDVRHWCFMKSLEVRRG